MSLTKEEMEAKSPPLYYQALGRACDYVMRCQDCQRLQTTAAIKKRGGCKCGNKRFTEVRTLTFWEMVRIRLFMRFPYKKEFLAEFKS